MLLTFVIIYLVIAFIIWAVVLVDLADNGTFWVVHHIKVKHLFLIPFIPSILLGYACHYLIIGMLHFVEWIYNGNIFNKTIYKRRR